MRRLKEKFRCRTQPKGQPPGASAAMSSPQLVLEHPLQGSSLDKQNVAGQLVRIYSDYFDDSITSTIELKEVHLEGDAGGLFSVTYYTAVTAMRLIRGARA